jgi:hypothetical protein
MENFGIVMVILVCFMDIYLMYYGYLLYFVIVLVYCSTWS